ncbi:YicC/YloC family endoribonuclease [Gracilibacillus sp. S3-1-1]|uniref:YicC/YloC family endoribonuclease n=1 Tax=Gracilibacillus pellucidus TaxID=3095368 RepID=A0ACC6M232_9BACI|nr:YicC/YloC family endoribonuclease [Gracilibacillus sp. S3-1-1]MDX8044999.1 YicC/YloC family endoribonuclease [Gracilibacillus sp. S3-1-1]
MRSMTGFGREAYQDEQLEINIEVKTINHRYFDVTFHMPKFLLPIEDQLKKIIQQEMKRGKISVSIYLTGTYTHQKQLRTDWDLVGQYMDQLKQLQENYHLTGDISIELISQFSDIFHIEEKEEINSDTEAKVKQTLELAVKKASQMRFNEGEELKKDLTKRAENIQNNIKQLGERRKIVIIEYQERILERINRYLESTPVSGDSTLYQEVALLAEKGDISEELTRIHSHVKQFQQIVGESDPIGRKLDFIVQEINRELNTIGSKSNDAWISEQIVYLKSEAEKMKEQIQNIE